MRRREFITLLGGTAATWPLGARAQQAERVRRIGVFMNRAADNPEGQAAVAAFRQALEQLGWGDDRNVRIDTRWGVNDAERNRRDAEELVALAPDVILASGTLSVGRCSMSQAACRSSLWASLIRSALAWSIP
jgi:putative ABC transport system substrate-binding protein